MDLNFFEAMGEKQISTPYAHAVLLLRADFHACCFVRPPAHGAARVADATTWMDGFPDLLLLQRDFLRSADQRPGQPDDSDRRV
jgi:hypothetical protein